MCFTILRIYKFFCDCNEGLLFGVFYNILRKKKKFMVYIIFWVKRRNAFQHIIQV